MTMSVHLARLLVLAVIFVNGWTDAPGAIATAVGSGAISFRRGVWMAAACNLIGAAAACVSPFFNSTCIVLIWFL